MRVIARIFPIALAALLAAWPALAAAPSVNVAIAARGELAPFPFHDAEYLNADQANSGMAFIPSEVPQGETVPLVVFLHGVNPTAELHLPDLTAFTSSIILRGKTQPFILAAPTAIRRAMAGRIMWPAFDLDAFVDAIDAKIDTRARVDREQVVVVGHSGAGCNRDGGLLRVARQPGAIVPIALLSLDSCLDAESGDALGQAPIDTKVFVRWQRAFWPRPIDRFLVSFHTAAFVTERSNVDLAEGARGSTNPHEDIVIESLNEILPQLLPPD